MAEMQANFEHPQYFVSQSEKLNSLLNVVVEESRSATDPQACIDYLELTEILVHLLEEAQLYSALPLEKLLGRDREVRSFVGKIQTVQDAVSDWDVRTKASVNGIAVSRKRSRTEDLEEETMNAFKRRRETDGEPQMMLVDPPMTMAVAEIAPSIESSPSPSPWWSEPFCD